MKIVIGCVIRMKKDSLIHNSFFRVANIKGGFVYAYSICLGVLDKSCPFIFNKHAVERVKSISIRQTDTFIEMFSRYVPENVYMPFTPAKNDVTKEHYDVIHFHSMNGRHLYLTHENAMRVIRRNKKSIKLCGIKLA